MLHIYNKVKIKLINFQSNKLKLENFKKIINNLDLKVIHLFLSDLN